MSLKFCLEHCVGREGSGGSSSARV
jgi:hypothetical protein